MKHFKLFKKDIVKEARNSFIRRNFRKLLAFIITVITVGTVLNYYLLDGLSGVIGSLSLGDDTIYSPDYTDEGFRKIKPGMTKNEMLLILGYPFEILSEYVKNKKNDSFVCFIVFKNNIVIEIKRELDIINENKIVSEEFSIENFKKIKKGMTKHEVISLIGQPLDEFYKYSRSAHGYSYRRRSVVLMNNIVTRKISEFYFD